MFAHTSISCNAVTVQSIRAAVVWRSLTLL